MDNEARLNHLNPFSAVFLKKNKENKTQGINNGSLSEWGRRHICILCCLAGVGRRVAWKFWRSVHFVWFGSGLGSVMGAEVGDGG